MQEAEVLERLVEKPAFCLVGNSPVDDDTARALCYNDHMGECVHPKRTMTVHQILIVDDDVVFREGLQMVLSDYYHSVLTTDNDSRAVALAASLAPDVVLIDPEAVGLETARQIKARSPETRVILLSIFDRYLTAALDIKADGYLLKGCPTEELLAAIRRPASPPQISKS